MISSADVVVVGGGPCGLAAALGARRRGLSVRVLESDDTLGGMATSIEVADQRVDLGSHRLHPSASRPVDALLTELLGDDLQTRQRNGRVRLAGRWVGFPFRPIDLLRSAPSRIGARIVLDLVSGRRRAATPPDTYAAFVHAGLGPTVLDAFHGPMATKLWGESPTRLAAELARRRISVSDRRRLVRRIASTSRCSGRVFRYPRLGYGQIVDRLADSVVAAGADLSTRASVTVVTPGERPSLLLASGEEIEAGRVFWTAPIDALARAAPDAPLHGVRHRGLVLVYLVVASPRWTEFDAHYVPDADIAFSRLSEPKNYRAGPDPADRTVLCVEVPATVDDARWRSGDAELAEVVLDGIQRCDLPVPEVTSVTVRRLPRVYPVITLADVEPRRALLEWGDALDGVTVLGRQGLHVGDNLHHVLDMALSAAACFSPRGWEQDRWIVERARFDSFVVDD